MHEFATDPNVNVAYSSYYAGGMRVFTFGDGGIEQTGKFIDEGGNNFWGVEVVTTSQGERLFAGSDRDFGLYLLRYTGPERRPEAAGPAPGARRAAARRAARRHRSPASACACPRSATSGCRSAARRRSAATAAAS